MDCSMLRVIWAVTTSMELASSIIFGWRSRLALAEDRLRLVQFGQVILEGGDLP